jgi:hypothetical protein
METKSCTIDKLAEYNYTLKEFIWGAF